MAPLSQGLLVDILECVQGCPEAHQAAHQRRPGTEGGATLRCGRRAAQSPGPAPTSARRARASAARTAPSPPAAPAPADARFAGHFLGAELSGLKPTFSRKKSRSTSHLDRYPLHDLSDGVRQVGEQHPTQRLSPLRRSSVTTTRTRSGSPGCGLCPLFATPRRDAVEDDLCFTLMKGVLLGRKIGPPLDNSCFGKRHQRHGLPKREPLLPLAYFAIQMLRPNDEQTGTAPTERLQIIKLPIRNMHKLAPGQKESRRTDGALGLLQVIYKRQHLLRLP